MLPQAPPSLSPNALIECRIALSMSRKPALESEPLRQYALQPMDHVDIEARADAHDVERFRASALSVFFGMADGAARRCALLTGSFGDADRDDGIVKCDAGGGQSATVTMARGSEVILQHYVRIR